MKKKPDVLFPMPQFFKGRSRKLRDYWRNLFSSTQRHMSRGSANISKVITWARSENWRRGREKKK